MRLFVSYRRDDTGGRAGRLFDHLVARFGAHDVFHDVTTVAPGTNFVEQVATAIAESDAVLVVIGPQWLSSPAAGGGRRIDHVDDFVRREVRAALAADVRVVPVLVDGASLPTVGELPDDLVPLIERQAVTLRDVSWHQDVDDLVRRLRGEPVVASPRRRWQVVVGVVGLVAAAAIVTVVSTTRDDDGAATGETEPTGCAPRDVSWIDLSTDDEPISDVAIEGLDASVRVVGAHALEQEGEPTEVQIDLIVTNSNVGDPASTQDEFYVSWAVFDDLLVDGVALTGVTCQRFVGNQQLEPGRRVVATLGYRSEFPVVDVPLGLQVDGDGVVWVNGP